MHDRDNVISKIEEEIHLGEYWDEIYRTIDLQLLNDILALLKEQDAVKIEVKKINNSGRCGRCPNCLMELNEMDYPNYCGFCGKAVKWDE